ncbi:MAG: DNA-binding protein [Candidatus Omnitrophica bacterium]|nr:DNA-binding protein [Candidatus Omnitrophota bacterium]
MSIKIKNFVFLCIVLLFVFWILNLTCYAQPVSSTDLIKHAKSYDAKMVVYEGEVIGDVMRRGDFAWVNVSDGQNAVSIWMKSVLANEIKYTGSYKSIGDGLEITGIFNRACPEHGGDLDIHAQVVRKTGAGRLLNERPNIDKKNLAIILLGLLGLIWILSLLKRK